jgi:dienelactone hydrolase
MRSPRFARREASRYPRREQRHRRRRALAIGAGVTAGIVVVVAGGLALLDGDDQPRAAAPGDRVTTTPTTPTTAAAPTTTSPTAPPATGASASDAQPRDAVGTRTIVFVDSSRTTSPNGSFEGAPTRTLPTELWYPAQGDPGTDPVADAVPDAKHGPYPLVLFAHGYDVTPDFYAPLLQRWAAAGYVVAAPVFPILSGSDGGASHVDYEKTFGDASFVITQILGLARGDPLAGLVDPNRVAAAGHSDGEVVSFGVGFLQCCRDPRVRSVIAMAGDLSNANNPEVSDTGTPILHVMETADEYDPYEPSIEWDREHLSAPRWMVSLFASHVPPYTQPGDPAFELVSSITVAFLDGTLKGETSRLGDLANEVAANPAVGTLER